MPLTPDFDLLAVTYLDSQDAGPRLREIVRMVATVRHNNPDPGQRRARKADLASVSAAAARLSRALGRTDIGTQAEAMALGIAQLRAAAAVQSQDSATLAPARLEQLASLNTLKALLRTVETGFGVVAGGEEVASTGGRPTRHDALLMGLEALDGLWRRHRSDASSLSENERGFCALAIDVFATADVGFEAGTVRNAVVEFLRQASSAG